MKCRKLGSVFQDQRTLCNVDLALAMYLDRFGLHEGVGAQGRFETLAGEYPVASNFDRGNCDDVVGAYIEPCRFAIDRDYFVCRSRLEHEPVRLIADRGLMEEAFDRAGNHVRKCRG
jgi:hypothetical protein